jgi:hypothetical protein
MAIPDCPLRQLNAIEISQTFIQVRVLGVDVFVVVVMRLEVVIATVLVDVVLHIVEFEPGVMALAVVAEIIIFNPMITRTRLLLTCQARAVDRHLVNWDAKAGATQYMARHAG